MTHLLLKCMLIFSCCALVACGSGTVDGQNVNSANSQAEPGEQNTGNNANNSPQNDDETENPASNEPKTSESNDSDLSQLIDEIHNAAILPLLDLNRKLQSGEELTAEEHICIASFNPNLGEPIISINCANGIPANNSRINIQLAVVDNEDECRQGLANYSAMRCQLNSAKLTTPTIWSTAQTSSNSGSAPKGPQLTSAGAEISYRFDNSDTLVVKNQSAALTGYFHCEYNLLLGSIIATESVGNCDQRLTDTTEQIRQQLLLLSAAS